MRTNKEVNAFEYLFGLSKYLIHTYDILGFDKNLDDDTVSSLGFELVNACLNDNKEKISTMYESIYALPSVDQFEQALYETIKFVNDSISPIFRFKGNRRSGKGGTQPRFRIYHSKFQILSMISTTFKEMYRNGDYCNVSDEWKEKKEHIAQNLRHYYVYDILINYWSEGGNTKIHTIAKPNRYEIDIPPRAWNNAINAYYDKTMDRAEVKQIASPRNEDYVFLNCIYLNTFTALDQLSIDKFDVEHIAPKEQMKRFIQKTQGVGLPISSIANLCYLPEYVNRSKKDKNFYQDKKYLAHVDLNEIEQKYSFTTQEDLDWMDISYDRPEDFEFLKELYVEYCVKRFATMKELFCKSMGIDYNAIKLAQSNYANNDTLPTDSSDSDSTAQKSFGVEKLERFLGKPMVKQSRSAYSTEDLKQGFVVLESKAYTQGNRKKYWFGYREYSFDKIEECQEKFIAFICREADDFILMPKDVIDKHVFQMNSSIDEDGKITHRHIVFFRDESGHMVQLLSKPETQEIDIDQYKCKIG